MGRALPSLAAFAAPSPRRAAVGLSMTSMIDVMVVIVVFMLIRFTASGECGCTRPIRLPSADGVDIIDAPLLSITGDQMLLDGSPIVDASIASDRVHRIDALFNQLKMRHEVQKQLRPDRDPPTHVVLAIDVDVPARTVKSAIQTAAYAGYPEIDFMVEDRGRSN